MTIYIYIYIHMYMYIYIYISHFERPLDLGEADLQCPSLRFRDEGSRLGKRYRV